VFLPRDAASWPAERRRAVLLHEMAHVHRGDAAAQLIARLALALYWWNPLEWIAWRELVKERERAADDFVLRAGIDAPEYASHLLEIARAMTTKINLSGAVAMARRSQLEGRLMAILDSKRSRHAAGRRAMWMTALCAAAAMAPLAAVRAQENPAIPADVDATIRAAQSQRDPAMLERVATAAETQRNVDLARKMLEAALQVRGDVSGKTSVEYGIGVLKLADFSKRQHGLNSETVRDYSQAADLLQNRPEAAPALLNLGIAALEKKDLEGAASYFSRSQAADPKKAGIAMTWLATVRDKQSKFDEAEALFKSALAVEQENSLDEAITSARYARYLKQAGLTEQAAAYAARAQSASTHASPPPQGSSIPAYRIGGAVKAPFVISKIEPEYSEEARLMQLAGTVVLRMTIGADGSAQDIQVMRSLGLGLDEKAIAAVSQWKFSPGTKDGQPVPVIATIEVNFRLL